MAKDNRLAEGELFNKWKKTNDPEAFAALYTSMKPVIYRASEKAAYGSNLPQSAFKVYAAQAFHDALRTFDYKHGVLLSTHVHKAVENKTKRLNYQYQNLGQTPEPRAMKVGLFQNAMMNLKDSLGREPTDSELAEELGWGVREVLLLRAEVRKELSAEGGTEEIGVVESNVDEETLEFMYYDLSPEEKLVFDCLYGKHGRVRMLKANNKIRYNDIAKAAGFSVSKARLVVGRLKAKLDKALRA